MLTQVRMWVKYSVENISDVVIKSFKKYVFSNAIDRTEIDILFDHNGSEDKSLISFQGILKAMKV